MKNLIYLLCGLLFGMGLTISNMINPNKIQNFLDIAGNWDPTLLVVMFGALVVTGIGYYFTKKLSKPYFVAKFHVPKKKSIDRRLVIGSAIFGIGWGLAGYCPGPGITALGLGILDALYFVFGMVISVILYQLWSGITSNL